MLIFLVVFGHMISTFADTPEVDVIYKIIFSFHMPAFIFVSGYFAKVEPKKILSRMGPGGGDAGGRIVASGTPQEIRENQASITGRYL